MSKESVEYTHAPEVEAVARQLIRLYHPHLMKGVRIEYRFVSKTPRSGGKETWGTCRRVGGLHAQLAARPEIGDGGEILGVEGAPFFCITISRPIWLALNEAQQAALVDHELCHAQVDEEADPDGGEPAKLSVRPHDLEEFACVVRRHGLWREGVQSFLAECRQDEGGDAA